MKERTENRITGWGGLVLALLAFAGVPAMSVFVDGLVQPVSAPLWTLFSAVLLVMAGILVLVAYASGLLASAAERQRAAREAWQGDRDELECEIQLLSQQRTEFELRVSDLQSELASRDEVVFERGAYFRASDTQRTQPFCRVCYDAGKTLMTVSEDREWDETSHSWLPTWVCPRCKCAHNMLITYSAAEPSPADEH